ncbi:MAG: lysophospholipid acyltransferase family protein [Nitrosomonadaceae bacterium]|nr:1-acyl-sn-glycerol-3-phosphate acyltransferase [Nitrosospira sp.]MDW7564486.1 lysophospholipid acyltransferase family protein [Nitrosomonadaceae bacterium]MBI0408678.1 1-acyl-sn-glycerol-3-phosphate acyltransferase [Nitrosospira sp.]MBI0410969.1 1-acyl-sn-glycerol-3-phosphate acyltransferase [Nitrosospira sp.]MBI0411671.1 1-acyl-sn-glycerol-3-phosphate acyltransferase [Nitrosospira sp.]
MILAALRSLLYTFIQIVTTPPYALIALATFPLKPIDRYRIISGWAHLMLFLLRTICGIRYRVVGAENIPKLPSIVLSKHQSAWETLAFQQIFPPQVWVLKKELLRIPFFGWGLSMTSPIAIDRGSGKAALKQIVKQGKNRLSQGFWIVIFPEGTRIAPGERGKYGIGGAWLATHSNAPVVPVAHNAGEFWSKDAFIKLPGTITVSIGPPIDPTGLEPGELNAKVELWIETEMTRIGDPKRHATLSISGAENG